MLCVGDRDGRFVKYMLASSVITDASAANSPSGNWQ